MGLPIGITHVASKKVGVQLGRCNIGMTKKFLHDTKVRPAIEKMRRKRVAQRMGVNFLPQVCCDGSSADRRPGRLPAQPHAATSQEQRLWLWGGSAGPARKLLMDRAPMIKVGLNRIKCRLPDWHDPLPSPLAEEPHRSVIEVDGFQVQVNDLADTTTRSVKELAKRATTRGIRA
ncbi:MAG: hypothetical protein RLZZ460_275, partial [Chloroflexota bacterium]